MKTYTPEIYWFDKSSAITAIDIQPINVPANKKREVGRNCERYYKLATVGVQQIVRIWEYCFDKEIQTIHVDYIAQLDGTGSDKSMSCCKFSPNGEMIATGDSEGVLSVWYYSDEVVQKDLPSSPTTYSDLNKEIWKQNQKVNIRHTARYLKLFGSNSININSHSAQPMATDTVLKKSF